MLEGMPPGIRELISLHLEEGDVRNLGLVNQATAAATTRGTEDKTLDPFRQAGYKVYPGNRGWINRSYDPVCPKGLNDRKDPSKCTRNILKWLPSFLDRIKRQVWQAFPYSGYGISTPQVHLMVGPKSNCCVWFKFYRRGDMKCFLLTPEDIRSHSITQEEAFEKCKTLALDHPRRMGVHVTVIGPETSIIKYLKRVGTFKYETPYVGRHDVLSITLGKWVHVSLF